MVVRILTSGWAISEVAQIKCFWFIILLLSRGSIVVSFPIIVIASTVIVVAVPKFGSHIMSTAVTRIIKWLFDNNNYNIFLSFLLHFPDKIHVYSSTLPRIEFFCSFLSFPGDIYIPAVDIYTCCLTCQSIACEVVLWWVSGEKSSVRFCCLFFVIIGFFIKKVLCSSTTLFFFLSVLGAPEISVANKLQKHKPATKVCTKLFLV